MQVTLKGTIRDLSPTVCATIYERMRQIVSGVCATYGATGTVEFDSMYPVIDNHAEQTEVVSKLGRRLLGEDAVRSEGLPMMGAEDFSYFLKGRASRASAWPHLCVPSGPPSPSATPCSPASHRHPSLPPLFLAGTGRLLLPWWQRGVAQRLARGGGAAGRHSNCMCHNTAFDFSDSVLVAAVRHAPRGGAARRVMYGRTATCADAQRVVAEDVGGDGTAMSHASSVANGPIKLPCQEAAAK